ncbi:MAG TPA: hypothetical protein VFV46_04775 [Lacibacter sp.]|nr:hypothetical protein [Lacibacter sp.]
MEKNNKILTILLTAVITAASVIFVDKVLLKKDADGTVTGTGEGEMPTITDGKKTSYTAAEVLELIKSDKVYLGDSVVIYDNGTLTSNNPKFQGTLDAVMKVEANVKGLNEKAMETKIPFQYHLYIFAATIYRNQYANEFVNNSTDSTGK